MNNSKLREWDAGKVCGIRMMERWVVLAKTEPPLVSGTGVEEGKAKGEKQPKQREQEGAGRAEKLEEPFT